MFCWSSLTGKSGLDRPTCACLSAWLTSDQVPGIEVEHDTRHKGYVLNCFWCYAVLSALASSLWMQVHTTTNVLFGLACDVPGMILHEQCQLYIALHADVYALMPALHVIWCKFNASAWYIHHDFIHARCVHFIIILWCSNLHCPSQLLCHPFVGCIRCLCPCSMEHLLACSCCGAHSWGCSWDCFLCMQLPHWPVNVTMQLLWFSSC